MSDAERYMALAQKALKDAEEAARKGDKSTQRKAERYAEDMFRRAERAKYGQWLNA